MHNTSKGRVVSRRLATRSCYHQRPRFLSTEVVPEPSTPSAPLASSSTPKVPRQWTRPIANGVIKAYDEALALIRHDSNVKLREVQRVRKDLEAASEAGQKAELEGRLQKLEIESQINLPEVRWGMKEGLMDLSKPVYRHLLEKTWRKDGQLDKLMERIHQMHVIPDVIPAIHPTVDLRVVLDRKNWKASDPTWFEAEPGDFLEPKRTRVQPRFQATVFHPEPRLYTLMVIDPDVPDLENRGFQTYLHLLQPNISLDAVSSHKANIPLENPLVSWLPPHPQNGTPYHRYVTLLLPQSSSEPIQIESRVYSERLGFNVRDVVEKYGLGKHHDEDAGAKMVMVPQTYADRIGTGLRGGIHMWRAVWDQDVSKIYQKVLQIPEPKYGSPPKPDRYGGRRDSKYY
ncbi:hypothetical protein FRB95_002031 [Tulasnella sp. JGI-2019a]|nr:hypothetical protein FRB93_011921 [Tulasnella sp. JGI-2019a]KAG9032009.1 hypothetical protein FRB95_002031 [Tulasnella sp. JGI-2019a]